MDEDTLRAWLHLANCQFSPRLLLTLLERCANDPRAVLAATDAQLSEIPGLLKRSVTRLRDPANAPTQRQFDALERRNTRLLLHSDSDYPARLRDIHDPPPLLFLEGTLHSDDCEMSVGMVGSRHASPYGRATAERLARELAEQGVTVISGGAVGIDTAAHRGALSGGGRTVAFLGSGLDIPYPNENRGLFEQIRGQGALLSEYSPGTQPDSWHFPRRNRLISGMAPGVVVIEAPKSSGSLITAQFAVEQGRVVMTVPGNIDRPSSVGSNALLREGATPVLEVNDVFYALGLLTLTPPARPAPSEEPPSKPVRPPKSVVAESRADLDSLTEPQRLILNALSAETPRHLDAVAREVNLNAAMAGVEMTLLEMDGRIQRLPGNLYLRIV